MAYLKSEELQAFKALARMLYFSNDTIKHFLENATAGQITAVGDMIKFELSVRDARKIERLMRKAKFPDRKSVV